MNLLAYLALLTSTAGWVLISLTTINLLSGHFDDRTCLTDCVQTYFYYGLAAGLGGLLLSIVALFRSEGRVISLFSLMFVLPLCAIYATLFLVGTQGALL